MSERPLLEIGRVERPHGVRGELVVRLVTNRVERLTPGTVLTSSAGPLEVTDARPFGERWLVRFAGVDTREAADRLRQVTLSAEAVDDPDELWVHDLVGTELLDVAGTSHGRVVAVVANPASDLLELESGRLVPLHFVVEHVPGERIVVDVPPGLLDDDHV